MKTFDKRDTYEFLRIKGFKSHDSVQSQFFGDYSDTFISDSLKVRFTSDKSFETMYISGVNDVEQWYDLPLVKAYLTKKEELTKVHSLEELTIFFVQEFDKIRLLFAPLKEAETKSALNALEKERFSKMFPQK